MEVYVCVCVYVWRISVSENDEQLSVNGDEFRRCLVISDTAAARTRLRLQHLYHAYSWQEPRVFLGCNDPRSC